MNKLLLSAAVLAFAATATAQTTELYLTGSNINGTSWSQNAPDAKMTYTDGVYVWEGTELGQEFKFTNGTWGTQWSTATDDRCIPGQDYTIVAGEVKNIFLSVPKLINPRVEVNLDALTIKVTGTEAAEEIYIIGNNVNGKSWTLLSPDAKMTETSTGVYEWDGEILGAGFKFNNGSWSNDDKNWGAPENGTELKLGEPYTVVASGKSGNIAFEKAAELNNPHVVLNLNELTVTVTGTAAGDIKWYLTGVNGVWALSENEEMTEISEGIYEKAAVELTEAGEFKIATTGWAKQFGTTGDMVINDNNLSIVLEEVVEGGNVPYSITGTYNVTWDSNTNTVSFVSKTGVNEIEAENNGNAVYYNLQGVRVANPESGAMYIKVAAGKASKIIM